MQPIPQQQQGSSLSRDDLLYEISNLYFRIRRDAIHERARRGWTNAEYGALSILGREDKLTLDEVVARAALRGRNVTTKIVRQLADRGLVRTDAREDAWRLVSLTPQGRKEIIEIIAVLKASEAEGLELLNESEVHVLRQLLRRAASVG